jgi:hypothetical protein
MDFVETIAINDLVGKTLYLKRLMDVGASSISDLFEVNIFGVFLRSVYLGGDLITSYHWQ